MSKASKTPLPNPTMSTKMLIIEGFPHPSTLEVNDVPTYESIKMVQWMLSANMASVYLNIGDGLNRPLVLTVTPSVYTTISSFTFVTPVNPCLDHNYR